MSKWSSTSQSGSSFQSTDIAPGKKRKPCKWRWAYVSFQEWDENFGEIERRQTRFQSLRQQKVNDIKNYAIKCPTSQNLHEVVKSINSRERTGIHYSKTDRGIYQVERSDNKPLYEKDLDHDWRLMLTEATNKDHVIVAHVFYSSHKRGQHNYDSVIRCRDQDQESLPEDERESQRNRSYRIHKTRV